MTALAPSAVHGASSATHGLPTAAHGGPSGVHNAPLSSSPFVRSTSSSPDDFGTVNIGIPASSAGGAGGASGATGVPVNAKLQNAFVDFVVILGMTPQTGLIPAKKVCSTFEYTLYAKEVLAI